MPRSMLIFLLLIFAVAIGLVFVANKQLSKQSQNLTPTPTTPPFSAISSPVTPTSPQLSPTPEEFTKATYAAVLKTAKGDITLALFHDVAPKTVETFIKKAQSGFYNNLTFHRVEDWVVQGGDPLGNGTGGGNEPVEFNNKPFVVGSLGQASRGDGKVQNDSQFFITKTDAAQLNGQYTNYGMVVSGMEVVNALQIGDKIMSIQIAQ